LALKSAINWQIQCHRAGWIMFPCGNFSNQNTNLPEHTNDLSNLKQEFVILEQIFEGRHRSWSTNHRRKNLP
jgi:hypothetical protein